MAPPLQLHDPPKRRRGFQAFFREAIALPMGRKRVKERKPGDMQPNSGEALSASPICETPEAAGKTNLAALEALIQSHEELTSILRSVGRRMLQDEIYEDELLQRMRQLIKRADRIRNAVKLQDEHSELLKSDNEPWIESASVPTESVEQAASDAPVLKSRGKRHRLSRPHALRIVK